MPTRRPFSISSLLALLTAVAMFGCASLSPEERLARRAELDAMADATVGNLLAGTPQAREVLERSVGCLVLDMKVTKIPVFGAGKGYGVVIDRRTDSRSYVEVSRFEIGGGLGAQKFKVIVVFDDARLLEKAAGGAWHYEAGAELSAGATGTEGSTRAQPKGFRAYRIAEGGAAATVTVRLARARPYLE